MPSSVSEIGRSAYSRRLNRRHDTTCDSDTWNGRRIADERTALRRTGANAPYHLPLSTCTACIVMQQAGELLVMVDFFTRKLTSNCLVARQQQAWNPQTLCFESNACNADVRLVTPA